MAVLIRCIRSDIYKLKHTSMLWLHILIPLGIAVLALAYYTVSPLKGDVKVSAYLEIIGIAFPLFIALVCSKSAAQEGGAGSFQAILCGISSRTSVYVSKMFTLLFMGLLFLFISVGVFAIGFQMAPSIFYLKAIAVLFAGNIFVYLLHFFISLRFGGGASIGLGLVESLIASLALTGLGDDRWYYIPCTWGARLCDYLVYMWIYPENISVGISATQKWALSAIIFTAAGGILSILWFQKWEGREVHE